MALEKYKQKRNFTKTPEPEGKKHTGQKYSFVIQKHAASRLHYDFRLELDGVLLSWAVPKGPSLDPAEKRLAVHVEDHPIEYQDFEGIIPEGEYGGGSVIIWDRGTWQPHPENIQEAYKKGRFGFDLFGEKLQGGYTLFRIRAKNPREKGDNWLLVKKADELARPKSDITTERPQSVVSGLKVEEIGDSQPKVWRSNRGTFPTDVGPELATLVAEAPEGADWIYEIKLDGYRSLAYVEQGASQLVSRTGNDWTATLPSLAKAVTRLPVKSAIFDGEIVALAENGKSDFQKLQNAFGENREKELYYYLFDVLFLDGKDLRDTPLLERKTLLKKLFAKVPAASALRYSEHFEGSGKKVFASACKLGVEGIIAKKKDSLYLSKRTKDWLKVKCLQRGTFIIGGYTDPEGARKDLGALLVGRRDPDDPETLIYAGKVGTGFTQKMLKEVGGKLAKLKQKTSPFSEASPAGKKGVHYVEPKLLAEIGYAEMTEEGKLRHPAFLGLVEPGTKKTASPKAAPAVKAAVSVKLTNPDRVLYEKDQVTKKQLAEYYEMIAPWMLPHVARRPMMLMRVPDGKKKGSFFQKHVMPGMPKSMKTVEIEQGTGKKQTIYLDSPEGLASLAQISALEAHTWGTHIEHFELPDVLVFDLDPDEKIPFAQVREGAIAVRDLLLKLGLTSFVKTTGGKGLHVVAPIVPSIDWDRAKTLTGAIAGVMVKQDPKRYLDVMTKAKRTGKIFIDYFRNGRGATFIAPYSTRARERPTLAMPISWEELPKIERADMFTIFDMEKRMKALGEDPWAEMLTLEQRPSARSEAAA
jgi:bifunctional non-homologous end joining protein LigD